MASMTPEGRCYTRDVLERMTADDIHHAARALDQRTLGELARYLELPKRTLTTDQSAARTLRRRIARAPDDYVVLVGAMLGRIVRVDIIEALGSHAGDPTLQQLSDATDEMLGRSGAAVVALVLANTADGDFPASAHCRSLLETHPHLMSAISGPVPESAPTPVRSPRRDREKHKDREDSGRWSQPTKPKRARRATTRTARPRYRKAARPDRTQESTTTESAADKRQVPALVSLNGLPVSRAARRAVRLLGRYPRVDHDHELVGAVVLAPIRFKGPVVGEKKRPCVVVAASGAGQLIVRTCYSEGGLRARDWRSVPIRDLDQAGLDRPTYVSMEERKVKRARVIHVLGAVSDYDWNQL